MADSGDHRLAAGSGSAGNTLRIKDPQILLAAAAAGHKDQIGPRVAVKQPDPLGDASFGLNALYADRGEQQLYHRPAAADDILYILPGSTSLAGHDPDAPRHGRQRALALGCKQSLGLQLFVQGVKGHLGSPCAERLHIIGIQLECTVPLVDRGTAVDQHQHAVLRLKV